MAIAGIPMPMNGMDAFIKGFGFNNDFMRQLQARNALAEQKRQHMEDLKLRKEAAARAGANSDLQRQLLMENLIKARHSNDPNYEFQQFQNLMNMMGGAQQPGQPGQSEAQPAPISQENEMPYGEGQGMMNPEAMGDTGIPMPQGEMAATAPNNPFEALKTNPMLRGFFKHKFGFDPLAQAPQTPEEKQAAQIELFRQKEKIKGEKEAAMPAAVRTLHENIINLSPKAIKAIDHIIDIPSPTEPWGFGWMKSGQKAAHNKAVTAAAENYAKAQGWPNTRGSIDKAESILQRGNFETDYDYHKRLRGYQDELKNGIKISNQFLHPNRQQADAPSNGNIIEYERVNGRLVPKRGQ